MLFWVSYMHVFCIVVFELVQCNSACFKQKGTLEICSLLVLSLLCWDELIRFQPSRTTAKKASLTSGGTCADPCQVQGSSTGRLPGQSRRTDQRSGDGSWKQKKQSCMAFGGENASCVGASGTGTSGQADTPEEVGLDRTHPQEASIQHHMHAQTWNPQGKRKRGQPHNSWRWDTEAELK